MQLKSHAAPRTIGQGLPNTRSVLLYGSDEGQIQQLAKLVKTTVLEGTDDPLRYHELTGEHIQKQPQAFWESLLSPSLLGGRRLVRIRQINQMAGQGAVTLLKEAIPQIIPSEVVLLVDTSSAKKGALHKFYDDAKQQDLFSIACYVAEGQGRQQLLDQLLKDANLTAPRDASIWLLEHLPADRQLMAMEVAKLQAYVGFPETPTALTLEEIDACCGGLQASTYDAFLYATLQGDITKALAAAQVLQQEGMPAIPLVRGLLNMANQLLTTRSAVEEERKSLNSAVEQLRPPIFFKQKSAFMKLAQQWSLAASTRLQSNLLAAEISLKQSSNRPPQEILSQLIVAIAQQRAY